MHPISKTSVLALKLISVADFGNSRGSYKHTGFANTLRLVNSTYIKSGFLNLASQVGRACALQCIVVP